MRFLLDANVLIALGLQTHSAHRKAHDWLRREPNRLWATCPLTQGAFLRHVTRMFGRSHSAFRLAIAGLEDDCTSPHHEFWPFDIDLRNLSVQMRSRVLGPNQVTDLQLLLLAHQHHGQLATLDTGIRELAVNTCYAESLHLI